MHFMSLLNCLREVIFRFKHNGLKSTSYKKNWNTTLFVFSVYLLTCVFVFFVNTLVPATSPRKHLKNELENKNDNIKKKFILTFKLFIPKLNQWSQKIFMSVFMRSSPNGICQLHVLSIGDCSEQWLTVVVTLYMLIWRHSYMPIMLQSVLFLNRK